MCPGGHNRVLLVEQGEREIELLAQIARNCQERQQHALGAAPASELMMNRLGGVLATRSRTPQFRRAVDGERFLPDRRQLMNFAWSAR